MQLYFFSWLWSFSLTKSFSKCTSEKIFKTRNLWFKLLIIYFESHSLHTLFTWSFKDSYPSDNHSYLILHSPWNSALKLFHFRHRSWSSIWFCYSLLEPAFILLLKKNVWCRNMRNSSWVMTILLKTGLKRSKYLPAKRSTLQMTIPPGLTGCLRS